VRSSFARKTRVAHPLQNGTAGGKASTNMTLRSYRACMKRGNASGALQFATGHRRLCSGGRVSRARVVHGTGARGVGASRLRRGVSYPRKPRGI